MVFYDLKHNKGAINLEGMAYAEMARWVTDAPPQPFVSQETHAEYKRTQTDYLAILYDNGNICDWLIWGLSQDASLNRQDWLNLVSKAVQQPPPRQKILYSEAADYLINPSIISAIYKTNVEESGIFPTTKAVSFQYLIVAELKKPVSSSPHGCSLAWDYSGQCEQEEDYKMIVTQDSAIRKTAFRRVQKT